MTSSSPVGTRPWHRLPILIALVALVALGFAALAEYRSPRRAWHRAIRSPDSMIRNDAWTRLRLDREIAGLDREGTTREVFNSLDDPDPVTRLAAVSTLPAIGADPKVAITRLAAKLGDPDPGVRAGVAAAVGDVFKRGG
jgi:hypothetical protein